jgi:Uncharacterized paraquat-inducible protein A
MRKILLGLRLLMQERYGIDQLHHALMLLSVILLVFSILMRRIKFVGSALMILWLIVLFYALFRVFSTNIEKRTRENENFLRLIGRYSGEVSRGFENLGSGPTFVQKRDPDKKYVKCPKCKSTLRVPRQKGKHTVRCPRCDHRFTVRIIRGAKNQ